MTYEEKLDFLYDLFKKAAKLINPEYDTVHPKDLKQRWPENRCNIWINLNPTPEEVAACIHINELNVDCICVLRNTVKDIQQANLH
jgi:hypothetical protein